MADIEQFSYCRSYIDTSYFDKPIRTLLLTLHISDLVYLFCLVEHIT